MENLPSSGLSPDHCAAPSGSTFFPLRRIVAVCDMSTAGDNAAWRAALLAREHGADLRLVCVPARRSHVGAAQTRLDSLVAEMHGRLQLAVSADIVSGSAAKELPRAAAEADLVVLRSPGPRSLLEWVAGTHPGCLVRYIDRPMLVVRKPASVGYRRVFASVAFDDHAAAVIAAATAVIRGPHRQVLDAVAAHPSLTRLDKGDRDGIIAARRLRCIVQEVMLREGLPRHLREAPVVVLDHPPELLLRRARAAFAELLVLAAGASDNRGRRRVNSDAQQVLTKAACDVLLIPLNAAGGS